MTVDLRDSSLDERAVRDALGVLPHPEGGHYREVWRDRASDGKRGAGTSILFMLAGTERSRWHCVDAAEVWLWHAGAPLLLRVAGDPADQRDIRLGPDLSADETLQAVVPAGAWQDAASLGAWTVVSCVVAPAFEFAGFELAPADWSPAEAAISPPQPP